MDPKQAAHSLDSLVSSSNAYIVELQDRVIARKFFSVYTTSSVPDISNVDLTIEVSVKNRLQEEMNAIPRTIIKLSLRERKKQHLVAHSPAAW